MLRIIVPQKTIYLIRGTTVRAHDILLLFKCVAYMDTLCSK
jgi:hypothetical protein